MFRFGRTVGVGGPDGSIFFVVGLFLVFSFVIFPSIGGPFAASHHQTLGARLFALFPSVSFVFVYGVYRVSHRLFIEHTTHTQVSVHLPTTDFFFLFISRC